MLEGSSKTSLFWEYQGKYLFFIKITNKYQIILDMNLSLSGLCNCLRLY